MSDVYKENEDGDNQPNIIIDNKECKITFSEAIIEAIKIEVRKEMERWLEDYPWKITKELRSSDDE